MRFAIILACAAALRIQDNKPPVGTDFGKTNNGDSTFGKTNNGDGTFGKQNNGDSTFGKTNNGDGASFYYRR